MSERPGPSSKLDALLSAGGWPYASTLPVVGDDPGRFHALFGRDSLITSLQVLPDRPDVARATLRVLAGLQGRRDDPETDEEPGKIVHEYRPQAEPRFEQTGWPVRDGVLEALDRLGDAPELYAVGPGGPARIPIANRIQAWTVGARYAFEREWDGRAATPGP